MLEMVRLLQLKKSNAPRKPPMIIVMAPPGVEVEKHTEYISKKYSLVYINPDKLVQEYGETDAQCK